MTQDAANIAIVFATFLGPVAAVQAQKWIEAYRRERSVKDSVFSALMYTRGTRVSQEHVQAINRIEIAFYKDKQVMASWRYYLDALNEAETPETQTYVWGKRDERFIDMLYAMSQRLHYPFTKTDLKHSAYRPKAHVDLESSQQKLLAFLTELSEGKTRFPVSVSEELPPPPPPMPFSRS
jgi:hypothetical protein